MKKRRWKRRRRSCSGKLNGRGIIPAPFKMSAQCNRVAVEDGHTESISIKLKKKAARSRILEPGRRSAAIPGVKSFPALPRFLFATGSADRPQPRFDVDFGRGMTTTVGRLRPCNVLDWKFTVLSHNTIRGAAGAALLNAELLKVQGYLD